MIKFVILDVYPKKKHRLIKDTAGGYGTGNDFGNTLFSKLLNIYVDTTIGMPSIEIMIISSILKKNNKVHYTRDLNDKEIDDCDFVILPSSIIAHETEIDAINSLKHKKIFVTGVFATTKREKYLVENSIVVKNEWAGMTALHRIYPFLGLFCNDNPSISLPKCEFPNFFCLSP